MPTPIEIPVTTPGAPQSTGEVAALRAAVAELKDSSGQLAHSMDGLNSGLVNIGHAHRNAAQEAEGHTSKFREFGAEIRRTNGTLFEGIKLFTSSVALPAAAFIALDKTFEIVMENVDKGLKKGQGAISSYAADIREAEAAIRSAKEEMNKKDAGNFTKSEDVISGLTAAGGMGAIEFSEKLSERAKIPVDKVNKVVLEGFQNGLSRTEITNTVMGAALAENTGKGSFESTAKGASLLVASAAGREMLNQTDANAASGLMNASAIHQHYSPEGQKEAAKQLQLEREQLHAFQDAHHLRRTAPPMSGGYAPAWGTAPGDFMTQTGHQDSQLNSDIYRAKKLAMDAARRDQHDFISNGPRALENQAKKDRILHDFPGIEPMVEEQHKLDSATREARAHRDFGDDRARRDPLNPAIEDDIGFGAAYRYVFGQGRGDNERADEAAERAKQHRVDSAKSLGVPLQVFDRMAKSLDEISRAVVKHEGAAIPK